MNGRTSCFGIALLLADILGSRPAVADDQSEAWSNRGVFAFNDLVFDFQKELEVVGPISSHLENCSDKSFFCAKGGYLRVALPRRCESLQIGKVWTHSGVMTKVLSSHQEGFAGRQGIALLEAPGPYADYLLGDPAFPHTVVEYTIERGIVGIYHDSRVDLVSEAMLGDLRKYEHQPTYRELVTLDKFGACSP